MDKKNRCLELTDPSRYQQHIAVIMGYFGVSLLPAPAPLDQIILFILLISSIAAPVAAMGHGADALNLAVSASERIRQFLTEPDMHYGEKDVIPSQGELKLVQVDVKIGDNQYYQILISP